MTTISLTIEEIRRHQANSHCCCWTHSAISILLSYIAELEGGVSSKAGATTSNTSES